MRLDEISKKTFVNRLRDPIGTAVEQQFLHLQKELRAIGWTTVLYGGDPGKRILSIDHDPNWLYDGLYGSITDAGRLVRNEFVRSPNLRDNDVSVRPAFGKTKGVDQSYDVVWEVNSLQENKTDFKRKLKYPMELVNGISKEIEQASDFAAPWIKVDYDQEFGDDFVSWTIEVIYEPGQSLSEIGNNIEKIYQAVVRNYQWEDVSLSYHLLNREEAVDESSGYLLMGIQLDV